MRLAPLLWFLLKCYIASCVAGAMLGTEGDSEVQQQIFGDMGALETRLAEMLQDKT